VIDRAAAKASPNWGTPVIPLPITGTYRISYDWEELELLPQHLAKLRSSAIHPNVAARRGYRSIATRADAKGLGFPRLLLPALSIPRHTIDGTIDVGQVRPDHPSRDRRGKPVKYQFPKASQPRIDVHPTALSYLMETSCEVYVAESALKADALLSQGLCAIGLAGVWGWKGAGALPDWDIVPLEGRRVFIVFDSDIAHNQNVREAAVRLQELIGGEATILSVHPPPTARSRGSMITWGPGGALRPCGPFQ
jgi:uncharacterized protein DUF3854